MYNTTKSRSRERAEVQVVDHFREKLETYLKYYNEDRIKIKLGGKSLVQYRLLHQAKAS